MNNYCEESVLEKNYCGYYTEKDEVLDEYAEELRHMSLLSRTSKTIKSNHKENLSSKQNGKVKVINVYNEVMSAQEFDKLSPQQKLVTIQEYKARHGAGKASLMMGKKPNWLYNQRTRALMEMERQGLNGKNLLKEHKTRMRIVDSTVSIKKKESRSKRIERKIDRLEYNMAKMQKQLSNIENSIGGCEVSIRKVGRLN